MNWKRSLTVGWTGFATSAKGNGGYVGYSAILQYNSLTEVQYKRLAHVLFHQTTFKGSEWFENQFSRRSWSNHQLAPVLGLSHQTKTSSQLPILASVPCLATPQYLRVALQICSARPILTPVDISVIFLCRMIHTCLPVLAPEFRAQLLFQLFDFLTADSPFPLARQFDLCDEKIWRISECTIFPPESMILKCLQLLQDERTVPVSVFLFAKVLHDIPTELIPSSDGSQRHVEHDSNPPSC
jgi:hypothetical protein